MIEDAGEIAQLASEYISSLENLPQEVQHIIKEIEHKDAKVQEVLPRLATREGQLRDLLARRDTAISEADKTKAERLAEKIKTDYTHADEWNAQKEKLSLSLWRLLCAHAKRLDAEIAKISPALVTQVEATLSSQLPSIQASSNSISSAVLGALRSSPAIEASLDLGGTTPAAGLKRKLSGTPVAKARQSSADRGMPSPSPLGTSSTLGPAASTGSLLASSQKKMKHSGLSVVTKPENDVEADVEGTGNEEKDDRVYCHCQRVSFGEMIGCDNDDCPYEWFHLSCVGVSKPLPQTWYCQDCRDRMERDKAERPVKKRKKQQSTAS